MKVVREMRDDNDDQEVIVSVERPSKKTCDERSRYQGSGTYGVGELVDDEVGEGEGEADGEMLGFGDGDGVASGFSLA